MIDDHHSPAHTATDLAGRRDRYLVAAQVQIWLICFPGRPAGSTGSGYDRTVAAFDARLNDAADSDAVGGNLFGTVHRALELTRHGSGSRATEDARYPRRSSGTGPGALDHLSARYPYRNDPGTGAQQTVPSSSPTTWGRSHDSQDQ